MSESYYHVSKEIEKHVREAVHNYLGTDKPYAGYFGYRYVLHENGDATIYPHTYGGFMDSVKMPLKEFIVHVY